MKKYLVYILCFLTFLIFPGCTQNTAEVQEKLSKNFLTEFYTIDDLEWYAKEINRMDNSDTPNEDYTEFHKKFSKYLTEDGIQSLITGGGGQWGEVIAKALLGQHTFEPSDITVEMSDKTAKFGLIVNATSDEDGSTKRINQTGSMRFSDDGKIKGFYFDNLQDLKLY